MEPVRYTKKSDDYVGEKLKTSEILLLIGVYLFVVAMMLLPIIVLMWAFKKIFLS